MDAIRPSLARRSLTSLALLTTVVLGCGGPPPAQNVSAVDPPKTAEPAKKVDLPPDLSEAPEPKGVLVFARAARPIALAKQVQTWSGIPVPYEQGLAVALSGAPIADAIDLSQPIDVLVAIDMDKPLSKPVAAVSVALRSEAEANAALDTAFTRVSGERGIITLDSKQPPPKSDGPRGEDEDTDEPTRACQIHPAVGGAKTRLVCAQSKKTVDALAPYLARTLPKRKIASDLHAEYSVGTMRSMVELGRTMAPSLVTQAAGRGSDPKVAELISSGIGELLDFVTDNKMMSIDLDASDTQAVAKFLATFENNKSSLTKAFVSHPEDAKGPPASFWRLPAEARGAIYSHGYDLSIVEKLRGMATEAFTRKMSREGASDTLATGLAKTLSDTAALFADPFSIANGADAAVVDKARQKLEKAKEGKAEWEAEREAELATLGWVIAGYDSKIEKVNGVAKAWLATVQEVNKKRGADGKSKDDFNMRVGAAPAGLPKGTVHYELIGKRTYYEDSAAPPMKFPATPPKPGTKPKAPPTHAPPKTTPMFFSMHLVIVPDGEHTWVGLSRDVPSLTAKLKNAVEGKDESATLAKRDGLSELRSSKSNAGAFMSLRTFVDFGKKKYRERVGLTPYKGNTPVLFTSASQAPSADAPKGSYSLSVTLPRTVVQDGMSLGLR